MLGLTAADANSPGRVPLRTKCRVFVGRHGLCEPAVLIAAKCKIPVRLRTLTHRGGAANKTDPAVNLLPIRLFVLKSSHMFFFFSSIKGALLMPADGPWRLCLVVAVTREVTPTSAVGGQALAIAPGKKNVPF